MTDELLDIVDEQDKVIGKKWRSEIYEKNLSNFRVVNAFLQNDKGQLWIPRRSKHKRIFPCCLDASMGGHVATGESYEEALRRELMEELRMDVHVVTYREIGILTPHKHGTSAFMKVFLIQCNDDPDFNTNDFIEFLWLTPQEVLLRLENGDTGKGDLPRMIRLLFLREHP